MTDLLDELDALGAVTANADAIDAYANALMRLFTPGAACAMEVG